MLLVFIIRASVYEILLL